MTHVICWPAAQLLACFSLRAQRRLVSLGLPLSLALYAAAVLELLPQEWRALPPTVLLLQGYFLSALVLRYIQLCADIGQLAAQQCGDQFNARLGLRPPKDLQPLTLLLNTLGRRYQRLNHFIASCADETQFTATELATTSEVMAACSEEQYRRLEAAAASAEQISATMTEIAAHIEQTRQTATDAQSVCQEGQSCARQAVDEIKQVVSEVNATEVRLRQLQSRSQEITEITASIDGISQQINLLALNASIEAARAGQAGRGFAVVADEIRTLAQQTNAATRNIGALLESIKDETAQAFDSILDSQQRVNSAMHQVATSRASLTQIYQGAIQTSDGVLAVSNSISEHLQVSQEMAQSLEMIAQLAARNRKSTEQTQDMVHYLNQLSRKLGGGNPRRDAPASGDAGHA